MPDLPADQAYGCICGEKSPNLALFRRHMVLGPKQDGPGVHKSLGVINIKTGVVIMPPVSQRTPEQKEKAKFINRKPGSTKPDSTPLSRQTAILSHASTIQFVPRSFTTTYTPIMQAAQKASQDIWDWPEMPLEDFIDTVFFYFFRSKGVILAGYIVDETEEERAQREAKIAIRREEERKAAEAAKLAETKKSAESGNGTETEIFRRMIDHLVENKTLTAEDLAKITEEVTHGS